MTEANWYLWSMAVALVGLLLVALGTFFVVKGLRARAQLRAALQDRERRHHRGRRHLPCPRRRC